MSGHFSDVKRYVCHDMHSDSYARHFAQFFDHSKLVPSPTLLRQVATFNILWRGNIVSMMKSFGTRKCKLCMKERTAILHPMNTNKGSIINSNSEIYGASRHKAGFHRCKKEESCREAVAMA